MRISDIGKNLIKHFEGCELKAYICPGGVWTIGYGHTGDVYPGQVITQAEADRLFDTDIPRYEKPVQMYSGLNQNQYDSLVSFTYNLGAGCLHNLMASGDIQNEMLLYNKADGVVKPGLVRRRQAELDLYNTPVAPIKPQPIIHYQGHIQNIGWQDLKSNDEICGTTGESLRLEALMIAYPGVKFRAHIENLGWTNYRESGEMIGTINSALRIEAIEILSDKLAFSVHIEGIGWTDYKTNGIFGTTGQSRRIEAIRIKEL